MQEEEFLRILRNIYATLNYEDWYHAREYVRLEIEKLEEKLKRS